MSEDSWRKDLLPPDEVIETKSLAVKDLSDIAGRSFQERSRPKDNVAGSQIMLWLADTGPLLPTWWSKHRDAVLRRKWQESNYLSGAFYTIASKIVTVQFTVEPRDPSMASHRRQAEHYQSILSEASEFYQGWDSHWARFLIDYWSQDNGAFTEIIGPGDPDGPLTGPAVGLANLDSWRCQRTGDPQYPVVYEDTDGKKYKLHHTRVIYRAQMPSPIAEMNGVGFCWLSRCFNAALTMVDVARYKQEKLGSRPLRAILVGKGIDGNIITSAVKLSHEAADSAGQTRFARYPVIANERKTDIGIDVVDLVSLPDGFDEVDQATLAAYVIALAGGFPPRWIWPATTTGATKADALYQHIAGQTSGMGATLKSIQFMLGGDDQGKTHIAGKFLPAHLRLRFHFQDDEQDRISADNSRIRSERRERDLMNGFINVRVGRQMMLASGDITEDQFEDLELADGRLPNGASVMTLFYTENEFLSGVEPRNEAAVIAAMQDAELAMATATDGDLRQEAELAIAALEEAQRQMREEAMESDAALVQGEPEESPEDQAERREPPEMEEEDEDEEAEEKALTEEGKVDPKGRPLPPWEAAVVDISLEDVARALKEWDKRFPEAEGLLSARSAVTPVREEGESA